MLLTPRYDGPPILSAEAPDGDPGAAVTRQRRRMATALEALDDDQWASPSRCDGWTVHDVIAHLIGVNAFWEGSVLSGIGGSPTRLLAGFDPAATPPLMVAPMRALSPAEVLEQFVASNESFLAVVAGLDGAGWDTLAESPPGHVSLRLVIDHALWDCWVHERDVLLPLGIPHELEHDEVIACLRYAAALGPVLSVSTGNAPMGSFGVEVTDPDDRFVIEVGDTVTLRSGTADGAPVLRGDALELVEALSMRVPLPAGSPEEWRALLGGLAAAFDAEVEPAAT